MSDQIRHIQLQEIIQNLAADVREGVSVGVACKKYPGVFSYLAVEMIEVGHKAGDLPGALEYVSDHLEMMRTFRKKLKSAALMPLITLIFFGIICLFLFLFIVPKFVATFESAHQELPSLMRFVLKISSFLRSRSASTNQLKR